MRNRRNTRGRRKIKEILTDKRFYEISFVLIMIIMLSILFLNYRQQRNKRLLAMQKAEIESQTQEIFNNIKNSAIESNNNKILKAKLSIVGDILCNDGILNDAKNGDDYYFNNMFTDVAEYTKDADYAIGTMETNFVNTELSGTKKYNSPISFLTSIKEVGIDMVSLAHNHVLDYGKEGLYSTIDNIQKNEISITGISNNNENENKEFTGNIKDVNGIKIAFLSYTYGLSNENEVTDEEKALANIYSVEKVDKDFEYANENADFVVVIMHWGEVNNSSISEWQINVKNHLVEKGANIILRFTPFSSRTY